MQKLKELLENDQQNLEKKISNAEIQELIDLKCLKKLYLIHEDSEYTYQQIYNLINFCQEDDGLQFLQNEYLISKSQNECLNYQIKQVENEKNFHELMLERFSKGFQFDIKECYFACPDIFHYIQLCFDEIKQQQQSQVANLAAKRTQNLRSQQQITTIQQIQKNEDQENSILNGIYGKFNNNCDTIKEQLFNSYIYYSGPEITKLINRCGWKSEGNNKLENLNEFCNKCVQKQQFSRAAAIACIHLEFQLAIKILKINIINKNNETQQILMVLQGLASYYQQENLKTQKDMITNILQIFRTFLENLKFEDPYYELIAEFIKNNQFLTYINYGAQKISIFDRLGLWAKFCEGRKPQVHNLLDNIILLGKCEESINYLQQYLDEKDDLQLCGIVSIYLYLLDFPLKEKLNKIFNSYIDYLLKNDISINQLLCKIKQFEKEYCKTVFLNEVFKQYQQPKISMICSFCLNPLGQEYLEKHRKLNPRRGNSARDDNPRTNICCYCEHAISNCVVCAQYFTIPNNQDIDRKRGSNQQKLVDSLKIDQAMVWCLSCKHGGHQGHIEEWFELYQKCPACDCECGVI